VADTEWKGLLVDEFASGVLVAAVSRALAEEGIAVEAPASGDALVPLAAKRRLLAAVADRHGLLPLLRVGQRLPTLPPDPTLSALTASTSPTGLFGRWSRLERFLHSRHRVVVRDTGPGHLVAEHTGPPGRPPQPPEDALVLGVLTILLTTIGVQNVTVTLGRPDPLVVFAGGAFTALPPGQDTAWWRFDWSSLAPPIPITGTEAYADGTVPARRLLAADPTRRWTLADLAAELAVSTRSLQRQLACRGGFTALRAATRIDTAAHLLMSSVHPLGVVGFASGYADQPHFTREFKRSTAMTPAAYRSAFARRASRAHLEVPA
jgi:AraC-like DNA-binding protein